MIEFSLTNGGSARLVSIDGDFVTLLSSRAAPPGTPLELGYDAVGYRVKVRACRQTKEDPVLPFRIEGRFQNLSREARAKLISRDEA